MHISVLFIAFGVAMVTRAAEHPPGFDYVGIGYNLLEGNPEGVDLSVGGVDPGLLTTKKIFKLTWDKNKLSADRKFTVPDQVSFVSLQCCVNTTGVVFGTKSYQDTLKTYGVEASAGYEATLWRVAFSLSSGYQKMDKETVHSHNVFYDEKSVCYRGRIRHRLDLSHDELKENFQVTEEFATAVCRLPLQYNQKEYFNFIENWGTHVVMEVDLGEKTTIRYQSSWGDVTSYAMENIANSVSVEGGYEGFSASLAVNMETFQESMNENTTFGSNKTVFTTGGPDLSEPISVKVMPIYLAMQLPFFKPQLCEHATKSFFVNVRANTRRLIRNFPSLKNAPNVTDPNVRVPLTWPEGTYGLPMPKTGCPEQRGFSWHTGTRYQDTENTNIPYNHWSSPYDLAGAVDRSFMEQKFCLKTQSQTTDFSLSWPKGEYCIFKKGNKCPTDFTEGAIHWDDEDTNNQNSINGTLPEGTYNHDTDIFFCCRSDEVSTNAIILPTNSPFVLLRAGSKCQNVRGMNVKEEYFAWDTEDTYNKDRSSGSVPFKAMGRYITLLYCYYYR